MSKPVPLKQNIADTQRGQAHLPDRETTRRSIKFMPKAIQSKIKANQNQLMVGKVGLPSDPEAGCYHERKGSMQ